MATENGWWGFSTTVELSELDLEYIAKMIIEGFIQGEIIGEEEAEDDINVSKLKE